MAGKRGQLHSAESLRVEQVTRRESRRHRQRARKAMDSRSPAPVPRCLPGTWPTTLRFSIRAACSSC